MEHGACCSVTYPLHHRCVSGQSGGQGPRAVFGVIEPADLLSQHGLEAHFPQATGQQLARLGKSISLKYFLIVRLQFSYITE